MKVTQYNIPTGGVLADSITGINFGSMQPGAIGSTAIALKPVKTTESNFLHMQLFLQSKGGFNNSQFGYFINSSFISGLGGGNALISGLFTVNPTPTLTGAGGVTFNATTPEYAWLNARAGTTENGYATAIRYMFVFDFN